MNQIFRLNHIATHPMAKWSLKVIIFYIAFSVVYIFVSDSLLQFLVSNVHVLSEYQTLKGIGFTAFTGLVMVYLTKENIRKAKVHWQEASDVEQKGFEEQLNSHEEKYKLLFNHIPQPMWIYDCETLRFLQVNNAAIAKYGYSAEEFSRMTIQDIRPKEELNALNAALQFINGTKSHSWKKTFKHSHKDGSISHVKIETTATVYEGRQARFVSAMDMTAEMNIQQNLCAANNMLRSASEIANLGYWTTDLQTGKIHWSEELYKIFGLDPAIFVLTLENIRACFHPDNQAQFNVDLATAFAEGEIKEAEHRINTPYGEKWILERITLERNEQGVPVKMEGITLDITTAKNNEKALKESNIRYEMVMKASVEAIADWDIENDKTYWGAGFQELFGHSIAEYDNTAWARYIHPDDKKRVLSELKDAMGDINQKYFSTKFRFLKANAQIAYVKHRCVFVRNADGRAIRSVGAMIDITESVQHLQFIEQQNSRLREIAWVQSHVVRGPLATLMGLVNLLKDNEEYGVHWKELIPEIIETATKLLCTGSA